MKSPVVRTAARVISPFLFLIGIYFVVHGFLLPGGGFQGGVLLASGAILLLLTHGRKKVLRLEEDIDWFETVGTAIFLLAGLMGIFVGGAFLYNLTPGIPAWFIILDVVISLKVFAGILALFIYLFGVEEGVGTC
ncbi:MAG: MnhB domain-containing protein [Candidatus Thermoplasmatota archaeon]